jgi:Flp pilus assembly protein TadB
MGDAVSSASSSPILAAVVPALLAACAALLATSRPAQHGLAPRRRDRPAGPSRDPTASPVARSPAPTRNQGWLRLAAAVAVGTAVWAFAPGAWGAAAAAVAALVVWHRSRAWEPASVRRRRLRIEAELPWVVDLLSATLRTGMGPVEALTRVAEVCHPDVRVELDVPLARLRLGVDPVSVWAELTDHPELGRLGNALRRATESGAPVVDALARLADDLRAGRRAAVEVRVRRIEVRAAVPLGVCLLPAFVLLAVVPLVAGSAAQLLAG